jgi:hypothetical protein
MLTQEQETDYRATLRNAVGEVVGIALAAICTNELEKAKNMLVSCDMEDVKTYQGRAQANLTVLKYLTERPLTSSTKV